MPQNWRSPPFYGNWPQTSGMGLKKKKSRKTKKGEGLLLGKNSPFKKIPLLKHFIISFVNKPLSNLDLLNGLKNWE